MVVMMATMMPITKPASTRTLERCSIHVSTWSQYSTLIRPFYLMLAGHWSINVYSRVVLRAFIWPCFFEIQLLQDHGIVSDVDACVVPTCTLVPSGHARHRALGCRCSTHNTVCLFRIDWRRTTVIERSGMRWLADGACTRRANQQQPTQPGCAAVAISKQAAWFSGARLACGIKWCIKWCPMCAPQLDVAQHGQRGVCNIPAAHLPPGSMGREKCCYTDRSTAQ